MNEELKLILETIRSLSGDASTAAYWYLGLEFAKYLISLSVVAYIVFVIGRLVAHAIGSSEEEKFAIECRDMLGIGSSGWMSETERRATQQAIRKLIAERKQ